MNEKGPISNPYHNHTRRQMLVRLPFEIVDHYVDVCLLGCISGE